ncbi:hypothetical protein [Paraburkholderia sprentiae]|nr:hypothetical protein [Paraburkholderia sprentiae]
MRFYPMLAAWLELARSDETLETTLQHDAPIPAPPGRAIPSTALRDPRGLTTRRARFTTTDRLATFQAPGFGPFTA